MPAIQVYLVRHAAAEKGGAGGDAARRLSSDGRERFGALLARLGERVRPSRIVTSPFVRARETAELLVRATGAPLAEDADLASGRSTGVEILGIAARAGARAALVGHNPEIAEAVASAAGAEREVRPGAIALVELDGAAARLLWIAAPEE